MEIVENILQSNHEIKEEPLTQKFCICDTCDNSYSDEEDLKLHMKVKHSKISHKCEYCDNIFSDEADINMHMNVRHRKIGNFKGRALLETKSAKIKQKKQKAMEAHSNIRGDKIKDVAQPSLSAVHEGKTKNKCEKCGKSYTTKGSLTKHIKVAHEKTKDHHCTMCDKSYALLEHLIRHLKSTHDRIQREPKCRTVSPHSTVRNIFVF